MRRLYDEGCSIIQIGVRSLSKEEFELQKESERITTFFAHNLQERWDELLGLLRGLKGDVYFTFDIDGLDPSVIPTTGTPQPDGLSWNQAMNIMRILFYSKKINLIGSDLVEYIASPHPPGSDIIAAKIVFKMLAYYTKSHIKQL
jgi:agmatinase